MTESAMASKLPEAGCRARVAADRKEALILTGMHRSGTSLVARMFEHTGVNIGSDLVAADNGNPHGYHEDRGFVEFHDELLGRSEQRIFVQKESYFKTLRKEDVARAERLVRERSGNGLWGWKDPRTSLFLDFWSKLLPHSRFVFMLRHPIDVVASLMRRDSDAELEVRVDPLAGLRSWEIYNDAILSFFEQHPEHCVLCDVYRIVEDPGALIRIARKKLGLPLENKKLDDLICREDLHATYSSPRVDTILRRAAPGVARLYQRLEAIADLPGGGPGSSGDEEEPELARQLEVIAELLPGKAEDRATARPLMVTVLGLLDPDVVSLSGRDVRSRLSKAEGQVDRLHDHCSNLEQLRAEDSSLLEKLRLHAENLEQIVGERNVALRALEQQVADLESQRRKSGERVRDLNSHCANLELLITEREATLGDLGTHAENLEIELGQRQDMLDALEAHIENLEADRSRDQEQMLAFWKHAENLEGELGRRQSTFEGLEAHIENLEASRTRDWEQISEHVGNLEGELSRRQSSLEDLEADRARNSERLLAVSEHARNLEGELDERKRILEVLEGHIENLEAGRGRDHARMLALSEHAGNLVEELSRRQSTLESLEAHIEVLELDRARDWEQISEHVGNLEGKLSRRQSAFEGLEAHIENLEADRRRDHEQMLELSKHADSLETELSSRQAAFHDLETHVENLQAELERNQSQTRKMFDHATELEKALSVQQAVAASLVARIKELEEIHQGELEAFEAHVENLEARRDRDQSQLLELSKHAENLEQALAERQAFLEELNSHAGNLEADRKRDREHIEELLRHSDNLASLRATLDERLSHRDTEIVRLHALSANRLGENERLVERLESLTSSFWVRLIRRLGLVRWQSDGGED